MSDEDLVLFRKHSEGERAAFGVRDCIITSVGVVFRVAGDVRSVVNSVPREVGSKSYPRTGRWILAT